MHITIPENLTHPDVSVDNFRSIKLEVRPVLPDPARVAAAAGALAEAIGRGKRVLALIGYGAVVGGAGPQLRTLVERFQIPFVTTMDGKGIIPEDHPLALGVLSSAGNRGAREAFRDADLVLAVGNSFAQYATFGFYPDLFKDKSLIHVNIDPREIDKVYKADFPVVSDARPAVEALIEATSESVEDVDPVEVVKDGHASEPILDLSPGIHPGRLAQSLSKLLPDNSIVLTDAGAHTTWLSYYLELSRGQSFRKSGSFGPMACHVNGALGVKAAQPDRTVVVGCGDGCFLLSGFELLTAVQYDLPAIWIIFNDGEFKLIRLSQLATFHESGLVDFTNPDYAAYARACGARGYRVETLSEFESAFQEAVASGKPTLIDAAITRLAIPHDSPKPFGFET